MELEGAGAWDGARAWDHGTRTWKGHGIRQVNRRLQKHERVQASAWEGMGEGRSLGEDRVLRGP